MISRIVEQEPFPNGILTTYEDGSIVVMPYPIDENGDKYIDLFPDDEED